MTLLSTRTRKSGITRSSFDRSDVMQQLILSVSKWKFYILKGCLPIRSSIGRIWFGQLFTKKLNAFLLDTDATTSVEYAVMLALIIGVCIAAISVLGGESGVLWGGNMNQVGNALNIN